MEEKVKFLFIPVFFLLFLCAFIKPVFAGELSNQFTISLWVNPTTSITSKALVGKAEEVRIFTDASGYPGCQIKATTWQTASNAASQLQLNKWTYITCTYNKTNLTLYVNGTQVAQTALTSQVDDTSNTFKVGQDDSSDALYSNLIGTVDQFQVYNYARTTGEILADMEAGSAQIRSLSAKIPLAYYKFDEGYGQTVNNSGSQGSTLSGTLGANSGSSTDDPSWTNSGKFGKALSFDGGDYINLSGESTFDFERTNSFTISAWINPSSIARSDIFGKQVQSVNYEGYNLRIDPANNGGGEIGLNLSNGASNRIQVEGSTQLSINNWYHVIATYDGSSSASGVNLYVNGKKESNTIIYNTLSASILNDVTPQIGAAGSNAIPFNGLIDEVKIYNYALTSDEVKTEYNKGASLVLGSKGDNTNHAKGATSQEYCIPGDTSTCTPPVGEWNFDPSASSGQGYIEDTSGNGNLGTWNGTGAKHYAAGKVGQAGNFNGSNDYVEVADNVALRPSAITAEAWIKVTSVATTFQRTVHKGWSNNNSWILLPNTNDMRFYVKNSIGTVYFAESTDSLTANTWYHVVGTFDGTTVKVYVNGVQGATTATVSGSGFLSDTGTLRINDTTDPFTGLIDQVKIYNYARSAAQVAWDYNRGAPVGYWKMDECSGASIKDSSGNNNTGTLTVGASGTQTSAGTCSDGNSTSAWNNGKSGKRNYSLNFDGTDDYITVTRTTALEPPSTLSLSAWIKTTQSGTNYVGIIDKYTGSTAGYLLDFPSGGTMYPRFTVKTDTSSPATGQAVTATKATNDGNWHQILGTYDGTNCKIYIDGVLNNSASCTGTPVYDSHNLIFGGDGVSTFAFNGQLDDVKIYNYALTGTQVKDLYNGGAVRFGPNEGSP